MLFKNVQNTLSDIKFQNGTVLEMGAFVCLNEIDFRALFLGKEIFQMRHFRGDKMCRILKNFEKMRANLEKRG